MNGGKMFTMSDLDARVREDAVTLRSRFKILFERLRDENRERNRCVDVTLDRFRIHGDFTPGHGFVRTRAGIATVELLRRVDEHGVICTVTHQITVANVMLCDAAAENDYSRLSRTLYLDRLVVHRPDVRDDVNHQTRVLVRVKIQHVSDRTVRQRRTVARDVVLRRPIKD